MGKYIHFIIPMICFYSVCASMTDSLHSWAIWYAPIMEIDADCEYRPCGCYFDSDYDLANQKAAYDSIRDASGFPEYWLYIHCVPCTEADSVVEYAFDYWFYYAYNKLLTDYHDHDWEHIIVYVPLLGATPRAVRFHQHLWYVMEQWSELTKTGSHVHVYIRNDGHASYSLPSIAGWNPDTIHCDEWYNYSMLYRTGDSIIVSGTEYTCPYYEWAILEGDALSPAYEHYPEYMPNDPSTFDTMVIPTAPWTRSLWNNPCDIGMLVGNVDDSPRIFDLSISPNPFNSSCEIQILVADDYHRPLREVMCVEIYDLRGNRICTHDVAAWRRHAQPTNAEEGHVNAMSLQNRTFIWQPDNSISSGIYLLRAITDDGQKITRKIVFVR